MMANKNRSEQSITVNQKRYKLKLTISAVAEVEDDIGMSMDKWFSEYVANGDQKLKHMMMIFHRALQAGMRDDSIDYPQAKEIIDVYSEETGLSSLTTIVFQLISSAFAGTKGVEEDSGNAQKVTTPKKA